MDYDELYNLRGLRDAASWQIRIQLRTKEEPLVALMPNREECERVMDDLKGWPDVTYTISSEMPDGVFNEHLVVIDEIVAVSIWSPVNV